MSDDILMLNIVSEPPSFHSKKSYQRPSKSQVWALKKQVAQKRKASPGCKNLESSGKQSRTEPTTIPPSSLEESALAPTSPVRKPPQEALSESISPEKTQKTPLKHKPKAQQRETSDKESAPAPTTPIHKPPAKAAAKTLSPEKAPKPQPKGAPKLKKKQKPAQRGEDRREARPDNKSLIKTSSLFNNNPAIPDVHRPAVTQLTEKVFTSDSFCELGLHPHLVATLDKVLNVTSMTSVQKQTIPVLMSGRDAVIRSQTGSGKTLAYGIPLVQNLQAVEPKIKRGDGPLAVIIVPTRELAQQTFQIIQKLLKPFTYIVPGVLMGGEKRKAEKARLRKGINILVATPGRLVDHIKNTLSIAFSATRWLILDEADRTLDLGFEKDLTVILNALNASGPPRQNVLLSATLTDGLSRLAGVCMKDPVSIQVSDNAKATSSDIITPASTSDLAAQSQSESFAVPEKLQQHMVVVPSKLRLVCLAAFILSKCKFEKKNKLIVFVSSCEVVEFLLSVFTAKLGTSTSKQERPLRFFRLHGNMKQEERTEVFQEFAISKTGILLCTDVAARGLDLPQVSWIVQYNPPTTAAEYVHRVGRTARIGAQGSSLLFLTPAETAYVTELANHNISLSEMKLHDILCCLMLDDTYKGRGKYHSKMSAGALEQEVRERATVLQTEFENLVHASEETIQAAKKALQSFLRAYTAYPSSVKHVFHFRSLHLGHAAKSFGLRDAPQGLASAGTTQKGRAQAKKQAKDKDQRPKKMSARERVANLMRSEYSSGMEGNAAKKKKKKKKKQTEEEEG